MFGEEREQPGDHGYSHGGRWALGGVILPVLIAGQQPAERGGEFGCLGRGEMEDGAEGLVLLPLRRRLIPVSKPVLVALVLQSAGEGGESFGLFLAGVVGSVPSQPPRPDPAPFVGRFFDEAMPGELAQMEGTQAGTVSEAGGSLGGGEGAGFGEQVEQGNPHGMVRQEPMCPVLQGLRSCDLAVSIAHFAKSATLQSTWQAIRSPSSRDPVAEALC